MRKPDFLAEFYLGLENYSKRRKVRKRVSMYVLDWLQSLKQFFINVSYHILVASLTLMALFKTEPSKLDWLQVYDMTH